jgi:hypothetical protein
MKEKRGVGTAVSWFHGFFIKMETLCHLSCWTCCVRKKGRGFGNFVPEFFIDAEARGGKIPRLVHNFLLAKNNYGNQSCN